MNKKWKTNLGLKEIILGSSLGCGLGLGLGLSSLTYNSFQDICGKSILWKLPISAISAILSLYSLTQQTNYLNQILSTCSAGLSVGCFFTSLALSDGTFWPRSLEMTKSLDQI